MIKCSSHAIRVFRQLTSIRVLSDKWYYRTETKSISSRASHISLGYTAGTLVPAILSRLQLKLPSKRRQAQNLKIGIKESNQVLYHSISGEYDLMCLKNMLSLFALISQG